jgi:transposase
VPKTRPPYPADFRQQIIELARVGRTPAELSREFGPTAQSIANWIAQDARDRGKPEPGKEGLTSAERDELVRLRRQLRQVQQERDILAKATAWFAGRSEKTSTPSTNS